MLDDHKVTPDAVSYLGHGTTVATNMVIEHRGSETGLLITKGFRDVLEIGRQTRPNLYDYSIGKPVPLVAREHRIEIAERVGADGAVLTPLDEAGLGAAVENPQGGGRRRRSPSASCTLTAGPITRRAPGPRSSG